MAHEFDLVIRGGLPSRRSRPTARPAFAAIAMAILAACAPMPLQIDRDARAPELAGYGQVAMPITTRSESARHWFAQGMAQAYAFNEVEAVRAFKAALAQDSSCAMCAWGVAYQLGPNINATERGDLKEALGYVDHALRHSARVSARERGLIEALALRYGHGSQARNTAVLTAPACGSGAADDKPDPLDIAYAERMRQLADRFPGDPDVLALYAEAEMIATRSDWWEPATGKPAGRIGEVAQRLEEALKSHPEHVGLNHYLIHAVDATSVAYRATAAAERLGRLAPSSPHLVHMPSHTFVNLGRYADASRVNQLALAADEALIEDLGKQGFEVSKDWRGHNGHFLWYAALMEGRGDLALETARASAARAANADDEFGEYTRARPLLTLLRLERWEAVLREPLPSGDKGMASVLGHYAQGVALARSGQAPAAAAALARLEPAAAAFIKTHASGKFPDKMLRGIAELAQERLRAEVALAEGQFDAALSHQAKAVAAGKDVEHSEPPMMAGGTRLVLGDMQLRAKHWADAEQSFRSDLAEHPRSGWALRGLAQALQAQGRDAEAATLRAELARSWAAADASLLGAVGGV
jgi:tetratricopeptide (TPR) repeat protein